MIPRDLRGTLESSAIQLTVNWFLAECYGTYLTKGSFFRSLLAKRYSIDQIRRFAMVFGIYRCKYPKLLGIDVVLSTFEREDWKSSVYHLLEELGGTNGTNTHGELFAEFMREVGLSVEPGFVASQGPEPEFVSAFYERFEHYCRERTQIERKTILAIFELVDNADYASLYSGLAQYGFSERSMTFFKIHAEAMHWENCKGEIETFWGCEENRPKMIEAFSFLLKLQQDLYEGMHDWIVRDAHDDYILKDTGRTRVLEAPAGVQM